MKPSTASLSVLLLLLVVLGPTLGFLQPTSKPFGITSRLSVLRHQGAAKPTREASVMHLAPEAVEAGTTLLLSKEAWAGQAKAVVEPFLNAGALAFLIRIVLSWYPQVNLNKFPVNVVAWPTEPFLKVTRGVVPPAFGVDISPIIWVAFLSFLREVLTAQQGILTLLEQR